MVVNANNYADAYYCDGPGSDQNVVPGRLGFNQGTVPYGNAWPKSAGMDGKCGNSLTAHSTGGCVDDPSGDGTSQCKLNGTTWNNPITVWRGITFQAEAAEGGAWLNNGNACTAGTSGCTWTPGGLGFKASNCTTPGSNGCAIINDPKSGMGKRVGLLNGASKGLKFASVNVACAGTANLVIYTTNGDPVGTSNRHLQFIVNGGAPQDRVFPGAGDWSNPAGTTVSLSGFNAGTNNTIYVTANSTAPAPDVDWLEIVNTGTSCQAAATGTCNKAGWTETASVNSSNAASGDDGSYSTRFTTGRAMAVGDYYQVTFGGTVYLDSITLDNTQVGSNDYAAAVDLYGSTDGTTFDTMPFATGTGSSHMTISFSKRLVKAVRAKVKTANSNGNWWSIGEFDAACTLQ
jgi:hypothetical protein